ncbi:Aste57867_22800 [Aphanomyces stellatus]|uniref:Aste57867_22800 protein n=1 Tax=Aphanomyces stellatus TaxID=120398 RepID=A0A485KEA3_9STRA|nr:hypothetical protein As57867_022730 [Aphanomyces stellatus]KAF0709247.1 hypothetical protein As57867_006006 [Aphanomyces stellatus]KAF0709258.1 hypothetical protein As57867_006017 [Aphanomyces stellatus]KAF0715252.1 hypothetical protein As57867_003474 [Aphanomyces stellatus]VFT80648.1 Aste57867_3484 [Aphanomyces stellatus]
MIELFVSCVFNACLRPVPPGATTCDFHKNKKQCLEPGCANQVVARLRCSRHGGRPRCAVDTCVLPAKGGIHCLGHGGVSSRERCDVAGCGKQAHAKHRCVKHGGGTKCYYPTCTRHSRKGGLCYRHRKVEEFVLGNDGSTTITIDDEYDHFEFYYDVTSVEPIVEQIVDTDDRPWWQL